MISSKGMPWLDHYDLSMLEPPESSEAPTHTLQWFLENSAENHPDRSALIMKGHRISYAMLDALSDSVAAGLHTTGFRQGDRAAILMPNCPQFVISYYGILKAGGVVIAIDPLSSESDLRRQLHDSGAETIFVTTQCYERFKSIQGGTQILRVIITGLHEYVPKHMHLLPSAFRERQLIHYAKIQGGDIAFVDFLKLGRKSGKPKMKIETDDVALIQSTAAVTHRNVVAKVYAIRAALGERPNSAEVILADIPLFYSYGMVAVMHYSMLMGASMLLIPDPQDRASIAKSSSEYAVTHYPSQPAFYNDIIKQPNMQAEQLSAPLQR